MVFVLVRLRILDTLKLAVRSRNV